MISLAWKRAFILIGALLSMRGACATDFFIDPTYGSDTGDGSIGYPWKTLEQVINSGKIETKKWSTPFSSTSTLIPVNAGAPVKSGDTIYLYSGNHGVVRISAMVNDRFINIVAVANSKPIIKTIFIQSSARWAFKGVTVEPQENSNVPLMEIKTHGYNGPSKSIRIEDSDLIGGTPLDTWLEADWGTLLSPGITSNAEETVVIGNRLNNVENGMFIGGERSVVSCNKIVNFTKDGIQTTGSGGVFEYNVIANSLLEGGNHDDFFQGWAASVAGSSSPPVVRDVIVRGNVFLAREDLSLKFPSNAQGIGAFDGFYDNWLVEGNLIEVNNWHGISFNGIKNSVIRNNTILDRWDDEFGPAEIRVFPHKTLGPGENVRVEGNVVQALNLQPDGGATPVNNIVVKSALVDPSAIVGPAVQKIETLCSSKGAL